MKNPLARVVAISSRKRESAEARAAEAGLSGVRIYADYQEMLSDRDVDAIRWFVRDEIQEVCAYSNKLNREYEYNTNVVGVVKFKGGAIGKLSSILDVKAPYQFNIDLLGDRGTIRDNRIMAKEYLAG